jgi:hypothetical protein
VLREALELGRDIDDHYTVGLALHYLGLGARTRGEYPEAETLLHDSIAEYQGNADLWSAARVVSDLGDLALLAGQTFKAKKHFQEALSLALGVQAIHTALYVLIRLAELPLKTSSSEFLLELALFVSRHPYSSSATRQIAERLRDEISAQLDHEQIEAINVRAQFATLDVLARHFASQ